MDTLEERSFRAAKIILLEVDPIHISPEQDAAIGKVSELILGMLRGTVKLATMTAKDVARLEKAAGIDQSQKSTVE